MTCGMTYTTIWSIEYIWYDIWYDIYYYMDYRVHMVWECVSESIDAIIFFSLSFFPFLCVSEAIDAMIFFLFLFFLVCVCHRLLMR